jgi:hypothetical protein
VATGSPEITPLVVTITPGDGTVSVIDTVFSIEIVHTDRGPALKIIRTNGASFEGFYGFNMVIETPAGDGGGICNPDLDPFCIP